ncbi:tetratricopeptide repeat protein [Prosthecobacter vanneervenii]|uniref:Uncharacterized protein n=1 Tax=Prosthecobacter vanneervenii TaxID=48466 RepID=A0A7W8DN07_9BACT|nr:tetratricopeptide repeat protein [Prosthecobacter vanneervenii]MBB5035600.1 hypothetical protein [Prosthecobacter vanneervenii]
MSRSARQALLLIFSYSMLAVAWGWRLHANDKIPDAKVDASLEATRTGLAAKLAHAPKHLQMAAVMQLGLLPDAELRALQNWTKMMPEQRVRQLTVQHGPLPTPSPLNTALIFAEIQQPDAPLLEDSRMFVSASGDRMEEADKIAALEMLATQALETNEHSLAISIHERVCEFPSAIWQNVLSLTEAAHAARRPAAALRVVNEWLAAKPSRLDAKQQEEALDLQLSLLLEGSRYAEASRISLDALRALKPSAGLPPRMLERALLATRAAGESAELLPWIEFQLRTFADHQRSVSSLSTGTKVDPEYRRWVNEGACIADLNHQSSIACDLFFRLAAMGETRVLARLHTLATQMRRDKELSSVIASLQSRLGPIQLAQALADGGAPAAARAVLAPHLEASPNDRAAWHLLTEIDIMQRGEASAPVLWETLLKRFPDDVHALGELSKLQMASAQYPQALRTLQSIPESQRDENALRSIVSLAIQLDDIPAAHRAQQLIISSAAHPAVSDVMALTTTSQQHADTMAVEAAQSEALAKLPSGTDFHRSLTAKMETGEASQFSTAAKAR